eukprot:796899_1
MAVAKRTEFVPVQLLHEVGNRGRDRKPQHIQSPMESCLVKGVMSGVMGGAMGAAFGLFMSSMAGSSFETRVDTTEMNTRQQLKFMWKDLKVNCKRHSKNFASIGFLYALSQCAVAKWRASEELETHVMAGCSTGAMLAAKAGPQAMCIGCAGFAAFSAVAEKYMAGMFE